MSQKATGVYPPSAWTTESSQSNLQRLERHLVWASISVTHQAFFASCSRPTLKQKTNVGSAVAARIDDDALLALAAAAARKEAGTRNSTVMATADAAAAAAKEAKPQTPPPAPAPAAAAAVTTGTKKPLYLQYPLSSTWEIVLTNDETITGEVYCTDPIADVVVLQDVSDTIRMISVASIRDSKQIKEPKDDAATINGNGNTMHSKKAMEEREKRAIRLAQESFRHLNAKATPKGQMMFDRLLKACNEVIWKGESIIVLNQIQVDAPYGKDDCKYLKAATGASTSLDRVQKIVGAASTSS